MKTDPAPPKTKSPSSLPLPTAAARKAAFEKLTQKDRDNFERQIANAITRGKDPLAALWRRLAGVGLALSNKPPRIFSTNTLQFFIADGNYRKQVYAMHLADTGVVTLYLPNILAEAVKAKLITPLPNDPAAHTYSVGKSDRVTIEPLDRESPNPQPYFKDMTGWNRKAIGLTLPADASDAVLHAAEQMMALAATWPAPATAE